MRFHLRTVVLSLSAVIAMSVGSIAEAAPGQFYIQTHYFDLRPLWPEIKSGYALFVDSSTFSGREEVWAECPAGVSFPDVGVSRRRISQYDRRGEWLMPSVERIKSALGGPLLAGEYQVRIVDEAGKTSVLSSDYKPTFLETPPQGTYYVAVRAQEKRPSGWLGYAREAWGLSSAPVQFN